MIRQDVCFWTLPHSHISCIKWNLEPCPSALENLWMPPSPQSAVPGSDCTSEQSETCVKNTDSQGALPQGLIHGCGGTWVFIFTSVPGDYKPARVGAGVWKLLLLTISFNRSNLSLMGHHELKNCVVSISSSSVIPPLPASSFRIPWKFSPLFSSLFFLSWFI